MEYTVIKRFSDLQDGNHIYEVGDAFPREGVSASPARIAELSSDKNMQKTPLIKAKRKATKKKAE